MKQKYNFTKNLFFTHNDSIHVNHECVKQSGLCDIILTVRYQSALSPPTMPCDNFWQLVSIVSALLFPSSPKWNLGI